MKHILGLEELTEIVERLTATVRQLTFRNLFVLFILFVFIVPSYLLFWLLKYENRPILNQIIGNTKLIGVSDICPVIQTNINGEDLVVTYIGYNAKGDNVTHILAKYRPLAEFTIEDSKGDCRDLKADRDKLDK